MGPPGRRKRNKLGYRILGTRWALLNGAQEFPEESWLSEHCESLVQHLRCQWLGISIVLLALVEMKAVILPLNTEGSG